MQDGCLPESRRLVRWKHNHFGQFCGQRGGVPKACICQVRQSHCSSQHGMLQLSASQQLSTCSIVCALCLPRRSKIRLIAAHACIRFYLSYCNYWQVSGREFFGTRLCAFHARHVLLEGPQNSVLPFNHSLGTCTPSQHTDRPPCCFNAPLSLCLSQGQASPELPKGPPVSLRCVAPKTIGAAPPSGPALRSALPGLMLPAAAACFKKRFTRLELRV